MVLAPSKLCLVRIGVRHGQGTRTGHRRGGQDARKMNVRDFVTYALMKVRLSVVRRPNIGEHVTVRRGKKERTRMGCNSWERVVMEDFAQGQSAIQAGWNAFSFS